MSIILGLNCYHADSSACIIIKGKLELGIEEERINRKKHWAGLPINSINACLINNNLTISDVTDIVINSNPYSNIKQKSIYNDFKEDDCLDLEKANIDLYYKEEKEIDKISLNNYNNLIKLSKLLSYLSNNNMVSEYNYLKNKYNDFIVGD